MLKSKKLITVIALLAVILLALGGTTVALLTSLAKPLENTFTSGLVTITLTETTGNGYSMIPGKVIEKDPKITVGAGSEDAWIYVKVDKTKYFDDYLTYAMEDGWVPLSGHSGIYYKSYEKANGDVEYNVLKDNAISVSDLLTEEKMREITETPRLTFTAYAIQRHGFTSAEEGFAELMKEDGR